MLTYFFVYLSAHFLLYALVLRRYPTFHRELPIFLYHGLPAVFVAVVAAGATIADPSLVMPAALVLSVQGIYSLSFLELWSLVQGGYSIRMLAQLETAGQTGVLPDLEQYGASKKQDRLNGLRGLKLVRPANGGHVLTPAGYVVAAFLNAVRRIANDRESG